MSIHPIPLNSMSIIVAVLFSRRHENGGLDRGILASQGGRLEVLKWNVAVEEKPGRWFMIRNRMRVVKRQPEATLAAIVPFFTQAVAQRERH